MSNIGHNQEVYGPQKEVVHKELWEWLITFLFVTKVKKISSWFISQAGIKHQGRGLINSTSMQLATETDGRVSSPPF